MNDSSVKPRDLAGFVPLNALSRDNLRELATKARLVNVTRGRFLFRDGKRPSAHLFLARGAVLLGDAGGNTKSVRPDTEEGRQSLDRIMATAVQAKAESDVTAIAVDRDLLDLMLTWDQTGNYSVEELSDGPGDDPSDWMTRLLQTDCFRRIPPASIQAIFLHMEPVSFKSGDKVITQGEVGDYFYIIREGRCLVTRHTRNKSEEIRLAELGPGDSFGEEALISDKERNATVTMLHSGSLMRMSKEDFNSLLNEPLLDRVDFDTAVKLVEEDGACWMDVRLPPEYETGHVGGAMNIPLFFLRKRAEKLDPATEYVVYCDTGSRSSAASFLLSERGFQARVLDGGLASIPPEGLVAGKD